MEFLLMRKWAHNTRKRREEGYSEYGSMVGAGLAAAAVGGTAHAFYQSQFGMIQPINGGPRTFQRDNPGGGFLGLMWRWAKRLAQVSFMASMIAIGQYFYTHFTKKWESESLPAMPIGVLRGAAEARAGGGPSSAVNGLLGGPSTATSATSTVRPGAKLAYEEYRD